MSTREEVHDYIYIYKKIKEIKYVPKIKGLILRYRLLGVFFFFFMTKNLRNLSFFAIYIYIKSSRIFFLLYITNDLSHKKEEKKWESKKKPFIYI